jgi:alanine dehydrogenase
MNVGVLKERKKDERRVALQPHQVQQLVSQGHSVWVEREAGIFAQYRDRDYQQAGASVSDKQQILQNCQLLLKVKCPIPGEYHDYRSDHILFTYLHFDENISPENIEALIQSGFLGIAYEWVGTQGNYPLLEPMSKITGHLFYQRSTELLAQHKGVLAGRYTEDLTGANILIIGLGRIGTEVLKCALLNQLNITVVARHPQQVIDKTHQILQQLFGVEPSQDLPHIIPFDNFHPEQCQERLKKLMPTLDIIINCAVRRPELPKDKLKYLIDRDSIALMQPYSVVCDATACDRDLLETCISSESLTHYDLIKDIIHYSPDHIPSYVPKTATDLLTNATFEYIQLIANQGLKTAIQSNKALQNGVSCYQGQITHQYTAQKKGFNYANILDLLN